MENINTDFSSGVNMINTGGLHEENPNGGVPVGMNTQGQPNLVEEGEVLYNNYVFSNRLNIPVEILQNIKLPTKYKNKSFALIAEKLSEEIKERENDPISIRGLQASMAKLMAAQEIYKASIGEDSILTQQPVQEDIQQEQPQDIEQESLLADEEMAGDEMNQMGMEQPYDPSMGGEETVIGDPSMEGQQFALGGPTDNGNGLYNLYNRYQKSDQARSQQQDNLDIGNFNRFKTGTSVPRMFDIFRGYGNMSQEDKSNAGKHIPTFEANSTKNVLRQDIKYGNSVAERSANIMNPYQWRVPELKGNSNLPVDKQTTDVIKPKANTAPFASKGGSGVGNIKKPVRSIMDNIQGTTLNGLGLQQPSVSKDMKLPQQNINTFSPPQSSANYMRYAPIVSSGIDYMSDILGITNKADYSDVDRIGKSIKQIQKVRPQTINNRMDYKPMDSENTINRSEGQQASNRAMIRNNSGGNRATMMANTMASDNMFNAQRGELARNSQMYNQQNRDKATQFNRETDMHNAQSRANAQQTNAGIDQFMNQQRQQVYTTQAQLRDQIDRTIGQNKSTNKNNFFNNIGNLGREKDIMNMVNNIPGLGYYLTKNFETLYKKGGENG